MKKKSIYNYIYIGTALRYLQDAGPGVPVHGDKYILANIKSFLSHLEENELFVTRRACYELDEIMKELEGKVPDSRLDPEEAVKLREVATSIRNTFVAEAKGFFAYIVTDKKMDIKKLLNDVGLLFRPGVFSLLPELAKYDLNEAGLCVAFERPTAAAFHILRATEGVLRIYYKRYMRPTINNATWGQIINALKNKARGKKPDSVLVNNLDNLKNSFRNPTQHPDKIYDIQEVQDLFNLCIDVINRMSVVLKKKDTVAAKGASR